MLGRVLLFILALGLTTHIGPLAASERRVALVIGNGAYRASAVMVEGRQRSVGLAPLPNPPNDAADLAKALGGLGFEVIVGLDLDRGAMEEKLGEFARRAAQAEVALLFYAGHGLQHDGVNYLAPVDAFLTHESDLRRRFVRVEDVVQDLQQASRVRLLILDACRDNDAVRELQAALPKSRSASVRAGLAPMERAEGLMVAFSTQPNRVALDGEPGTRNSPFAAALLKHIATPGLEARGLFTRVRSEVDQSTRRQQRPEVWDSLVGEFYLGKTPESVPVPQADEVAWSFLEQFGSARQIEEWLRRFPASTLASKAHERLAALVREEQALQEASRQGGVPAPVTQAPPAPSAPALPTTRAGEEAAPSPGMTFNRTYGAGRFEAVAATPDGGYVLAGSAQVMSGEQVLSSHPTVVRVNARGDVVWERGLDGREGASMDSVQITPDGHALISGTAGLRRGEPLLPDAKWLLTLGPAGEIVSERTFDGALRRPLQKVLPLKRGVYGVLTDNSIMTGTAGIELSAFTDRGERLWETRMTDVAMDCSGAITGDRSGNLIAAVSNEKSTATRFRRLDQGRTVVDRAFGSIGDGCPHLIRGLRGGGFIVVGMRSHALGETGWIARLDEEGGLVWDRAWGPKDTLTAFYAAAEAANGDLVVGGCMVADKAGPSKAIVLRLDNAGAVTGTQAFESSKGVMVRTAEVSGDGTVLVAGMLDRGCGEIDGFAFGGTLWAAALVPSAGLSSR